MFRRLIERQSREAENPLLFVYTTHRDDVDGAPIARIAAQRADVVLLESVGDAEEYRAGWDQMYDTITKVPEKRWSASIKKWYSEILQRDNLDMYLQLAIALKGSGKTMRAVDELDSDTHRKENTLFEDLQHKQIQGLLSQTPIDDLLGITDAKAKLWGLAGRRREETVWRQINEFYRPLSIGHAATRFMVIQGAAHTSSYHAAKEANFPAERTFIMHGKTVQPSDIAFDPQSALARHYTFYPNKSAPRTLVSRELIASYMHRVLDPGLPLPTHLATNEKIRQKVTSLKPQEMDEVLGAVNTQKEVVATRPERIEKITDILRAHDLLLETTPGFQVL